jgi:hypothetical protein
MPTTFEARTQFTYMLIGFVIGVRPTLIVVVVIYSIRLHRRLHTAKQQNVSDGVVGIGFSAASGIDMRPAPAAPWDV